MKYIKNERAWKTWAHGVNRWQRAPIDPPAKYPCYVYLTVLSYAYEEDAANYLYTEDVAKMHRLLMGGASRKAVAQAFQKRTVAAEVSHSANLSGGEAKATPETELYKAIPPAATGANESLSSRDARPAQPLAANREAGR